MQGFLRELSISRLRVLNFGATIRCGIHKEALMRMEIRGRNVEMTDDLREMVRKRFQRLGRQVSPLATLEVVLSEERNPRVADSQVAEATFYLKGVTLHAREASPEMTHSVHELAEDVSRQVKKHRELRRKRRRTRRLVDQMRGRPAEARP